MTKIRNIHSAPLRVPGLGIIGPGQVVEVDEKTATGLIATRNFERATETERKTKDRQKPKE